MTRERIGQARDFLNECLRQASPRLSLIGDLGVDRFIMGGVDRISPEAPVAVLKVEKQLDCLGCAGNVVRNICELLPSNTDWRLSFHSVIGDDELGSQVRRLFDPWKEHLDLHLAIQKGRPTTLKTRFIAGKQHQLLRVDFEDASPHLGAHREEILSAIETFDEGHVLIVEDYAKGLLDREFLSAILIKARTQKVRTLVDPHRSVPAEFYQGAWMIKPNLAEAERLLNRDLRGGENDELVAQAARDLKLQLDARVVLISRNRFGSTLVNEGGEALHLPAFARSVFDVTGAGDTMLASLATFIACGADLALAALLANAAASVVVAKVGTATASVDEILSELESIEKNNKNI